MCSFQAPSPSSPPGFLTLSGILQDLSHLKTFTPVLFSSSLALRLAASHSPYFVLNLTFPGHSLSLLFSLTSHLADLLFRTDFCLKLFKSGSGVIHVFQASFPKFPALRLDIKPFTCLFISIAPIIASPKNPVLPWFLTRQTRFSQVIWRQVFSLPVKGLCTSPKLQLQWRLTGGWASE